MSAMDVFWLFLMLIALQPVIKRRFLEASRQRLIAQIEKKRGSRVILLVHRQETMSFLGFPLFRYIDIHDAEDVMRALHLTDPGVPLDLVLHTPGGLVLAATQIAHAIRQYKGRVTVFVPHYAMSGGTLIALAADQIIMCDHAVLGPVDPQLGQKPAVSVLKVIERKPVEEIDDETLILADQAEKAVKQLRATVTALLSDRYSPEKVDQLAQLLTEGTWTHDYPITFEQARDMGLHVSTEMPEEMVKLLSLYPQPVRQQPTVEYLPGQRRGRRVSGSSSVIQ
jgi:ClpP class serine protease